MGTDMITTTNMNRITVQAERCQRQNTESEQILAGATIDFIAINQHIVSGPYAHVRLPNGKHCAAQRAVIRGFAPDLSVWFAQHSGINYAAQFRLMARVAAHTPFVR